MAMLAVIFVISLFPYSLALTLFFLGLFKKEAERTGDRPFVTVLIATKNEEENITNVLEDVSHQTYPRENYEVMVVDDESTDRTPQICRMFAEKYVNLRLLSTKGSPRTLRAKKRPLNVGINQAGGEIIVLTDADCRVPNTWVESIVSYFAQGIGMVIGFAEVKPAESPLANFQRLDFLMLMTGARGSAQIGVPFACSGQNLAYRKSVFNAVGGFTEFADAVCGDDTLLLQQIKKDTSSKIVFADDPASFISSPPLPSVRGFLSQRGRWSADILPLRKTDPLLFSIIVATYLVNVSALVNAIYGFFSFSIFPLFLIGLLWKFLVEGSIMLKGTSFFAREELRRSFPFWFVLQIPYIVVTGLLGLAGRRLAWGWHFR